MKKLISTRLKHFVFVIHARNRDRLSASFLVIFPRLHSNERIDQQHTYYRILNNKKSENLLTLETPLIIHLNKYKWLIYAYIIIIHRLKNWLVTNLFHLPKRHNA